jgi:hypothetical protein
VFDPETAALEETAMRRIGECSRARGLVLAVVAAVAMLGIVGSGLLPALGGGGSSSIPLGLITGQGLRVAMANLGGVTCEVAVVIKEQGGSSLLNERGIVVIGGRVAVRDVNFDELRNVAPDSRGRLEVFARVHYPPGSCSQMLQTSFHVFNSATGETLLATHGVATDGSTP